MSDGPSWSRIADTLGHDSHIARLTVKNHVGCGHVFPAIDGALALQHKHGVDPQNIRHIHIETYQPALAITSPDDRSEQHKSELPSPTPTSHAASGLKKTTTPAQTPPH